MSMQPGAGPTVRACPARMLTAGGELCRLGHDLGQQVRTALPVLASVRDGGWLASQAAAAAAHAWHDVLTELAGQLAELGGAIRAAADAYDSCDARAAARAAAAVAW